jgi:arginine exporter protein ArgO
LALLDAAFLAVYGWQALRNWFVVGACTASLVWFSLLGFGRTLASPWFARQTT